ncbi:MAG: P-loop NTPase fold protein, partial [Planctomycetota bacterium]
MGDRLNLNTGDEPSPVDTLGRHRELLSLVDVIVNQKPPLVIGVYGDWGRGKTSFMRALRALLVTDDRKKYIADEAKLEVPEDIRIGKRAQALFDAHDGVDEFATVWFNPWQHQFDDQIVLPLLDAIRTQHKTGWNKTKGRIKDVVDDPRTRLLFKAMLGTARLTVPSLLGDMAGEVAGAAKTAIDRFGSLSQDFEDCLDKLTENRGGKMIIFLDDLDRCESEHVVRTLEALKLYLANEHCIFVIGAARKRVLEALRSKFIHLREGRGAEEYLEKIVQVPMPLPPVYGPQLRSMLRGIGLAAYADEPRCLALLQAYCGDNPRKLKRFLMWHDLELKKLKHTPGLPELLTPLTDDFAVPLKINLMRFREKDFFLSIGNFERDRREASGDAAATGEEPADAGHYHGERRKGLSALEPFIGDILADHEASRPKLMLQYLTLTIDLEEAEEEYQSSRAEASADQQAIVNTAIEDAGGRDNARSLDFEGTEISNDGLRLLERLPQLDKLDLGGTQVTDAGVEHLKPLTQLQRLSLDGT